MCYHVDEEELAELRKAMLQAEAQDDVVDEDNAILDDFLLSATQVRKCLCKHAHLDVGCKPRCVAVTGVGDAQGPTVRLTPVIKLMVVMSGCVTG